MDTPPAPAPFSVPPPPSALPGSRIKWGFGGAFLIVLVVVVVGAAYWYIKRPYSEQEILALIRSDIVPSIVQVRCTSEEGGEEDQSGSGIYYLDKTDNTPWVQTNAHVVLGADGSYHGCNVYFPRPGDGSFYDSVYGVGDPLVYDKSISTIGEARVEGEDIALLPLEHAYENGTTTYPFPPAKPDINAAMNKLCKRNLLGRDVGLGDKVYVLGYPYTGGESLTLTQGVVSGFEGQFGEKIKVSAGTNFGGSGGLAIGASNGCGYGMITRATQVLGSDLTYVLSFDYLQEFLDNLTGEVAYTPPSTDETDVSMDAHITQPYNFQNISLRYPTQWVASTSPIDAEGVLTVQFVSPWEGTLDDFADHTTVLVYPSQKESDFGEAVSAAKELGAQLDPEFASQARYVTLKGTVRTYQIVFRDAEGVGFGVPAVGYYIIFQHKGLLYQFMSAAEIGPHMYDYLNLFAGIGDSIEFR